MEPGARTRSERVYLEIFMSKIRSENQVEEITGFKFFFSQVRKSYTRRKCGKETSLSAIDASRMSQNPHAFHGLKCDYCGRSEPLYSNGFPNFVWSDGFGIPVGYVDYRMVAAAIESIMSFIRDAKIAESSKVS